MPRGHRAPSTFIIPSTFACLAPGEVQQGWGSFTAPKPHSCKGLMVVGYMCPPPTEQPVPYSEEETEISLVGRWCQEDTGHCEQS